MSGGLTDQDVGLNNHPYTYAEFKNDVERALRSHFGSASVVRGVKAFDIHENSYRLDADVVACFEYRRYHRKSDGGFHYHSGTKFLPDKGTGIYNFPQQNYDNGVSKNTKTNQRFKNVVRILKRLRNRMADEKVSAAIPIPSYLIECLIWNVPDGYLGNQKHVDDVRTALAFLFNHTIKSEDYGEWGEINELKYLFRLSQPWTVEQAHAFTSAAWDYLGF